MLSKPSLEQITPSFGSSIFAKQYVQNRPNEQPVWHFHPEMELVYINEGSGKRHVGNQLSFYEEGDLILIGPNLPHFGFVDSFTSNKSETILQMKPDFLGEKFFDLPEMKDIRQLFERSKMGISFHGNTRKDVGKKIEQLYWDDDFSKLMNLITIFQLLAESKEYTILNAEGYMLEVGTQDNDRIEHIYNFVRNNYKRHITLDEAAEMVSMTVPAFCRYFKKISGKTFTQFVNEYRLVHASKLLSTEPMSITEICFESGFSNFSHFNKLFRKFTGKSPSAYRNEVKKILQ
jgi:AraC-like DNA-binding protein/uncharacterized RmlC-like cupin family protein